jgi:hypothetical protein
MPIESGERPPDTAYRCTYGEEYVSVNHRSGLPVISDAKAA